MKLKRVLSGVIGFPIVALIFIYGNKYIIDAFIGIISIIAMYEYLKCLSVDYKPVKWVAYIPCLLIPFLHVIPKEYLLTTIAVSISLIVALLFMKVIASNMKTSISDIAVTLFGICYITVFLSFISFWKSFRLSPDRFPSVGNVLFMSGIIKNFLQIKGNSFFLTNYSD